MADLRRRRERATRPGQIARHPAPVDPPQAEQRPGVAIARRNRRFENMESLAALAGGRELDRLVRRRERGQARAAPASAGTVPRAGERRIRRSAMTSSTTAAARWLEQ